MKRDFGRHHLNAGPLLFCSFSSGNKDSAGSGLAEAGGGCSREAAGSGFGPSCSNVKQGSEQQEHTRAVFYGETVAPIIPTGTHLHFVSGEQTGSPRPSPQIISPRDASPCPGASLGDSKAVQGGGQVTFACCRQIPEKRVCSVWAFCGWAQYRRVGRARNA